MRAYGQNRRNISRTRIGGADSTSSDSFSDKRKNLRTENPKKTSPSRFGKPGGGHVTAEPANQKKPSALLLVRRLPLEALPLNNESRDCDAHRD
ncbi:hypothetical protein [Amycolatopsis taiwanensis]|uniref:hypothetical protein n=1 Tax=Amycolatopsis taiwanensis TaxID=342230 RepID=UPI00146FC136|nr:hypothetical protein [Amycolatopsis taiwanensis]